MRSTVFVWSFLPLSCLILDHLLWPDEHLRLVVNVREVDFEYCVLDGLSRKSCERIESLKTVAMTVDEWDSFTQPRRAGLQEF